MCTCMCAHNYEEAVNSSSILENSQIGYPLPKCHIVCIYVDVCLHIWNVTLFGATCVSCSVHLCRCMPTYLHHSREVKVVCDFVWNYISIDSSNLRRENLEAFEIN